MSKYQCMKLLVTCCLLACLTGCSWLSELFGSSSSSGSGSSGGSSSQTFTVQLTDINLSQMSSGESLDVDTTEVKSGDLTLK